MQIIHYGTYDDYTELAYANYTAHSATALQIIQDDLIGHLNAELENLNNNLQFDWAKPEIRANKRLLESVQNCKTLDDYKENEYIHFVILDLSGDFTDAYTADLD